MILFHVVVYGFPDYGGVCETEPIQPIQNSETHELDDKKTEKEESDISQLFAIGRHQLNRCLKCNKEEGRESVVLACALQYPSVTSRENEQKGSFIELIRASLSSRRSTPAWCEQCGKFTPTSQRGRLIRLPPILAINCGGVNVREKAYWAKGSQKDSPELYPYKFVEESHARVELRSTTAAPHSVACDTSSSEPNSPNHRIESKFKKKIITTAPEEEYCLTAAVVCVEDNPKNLI
ncbi:Ubiquitin specific protease 52, partial [Operophtera brumata]